MKISIVAVNWWAEDFAKLLVDSVFSHASENPDIEVILVDNSKNLKQEDFDCYKNFNVKILKPDENLGHGVGMNHGIGMATGDYILALDIDSHILLKDFDLRLIEQVTNNPETKLFAARGGDLKPVRPLCMFFEKKYFFDNGDNFKAVNLDGVKFDVGVHFYFRTLSRGGKVKFLEYKKTEYKDVWGEEYTLNGESLVFHHWYGTRWFNVNGEAVHEMIDGRKFSDFVISKNNLFEQI